MRHPAVARRRYRPLRTAFTDGTSAPADMADDLEAYYIEKGVSAQGRPRRSRTQIEAPVTVNYRGYTVCKCGPWTQGPYLCQTLRLLEGFDLKAMGHLSADYVHVVIEAIKLAMADRDAYYGDPNFVDVPMSGLLSDAYTEIRRPLIDMRHASLEARPGDPIKMTALKGPGRVPARGRRYHDVRRGRPLGERRLGHAERKRGELRRGPDGRHLQQPPGQSQYRAGASQLYPARQAPAHHADADAGAQGRQADPGDQRSRRGYSRSGDSKSAAGFHRISEWLRKPP